MSSQSSTTPPTYLSKTEVLSRFYQELNKDPSRITRYNVALTRKGNNDSPNTGIPWNNLFGAVVGSLGFGAIFGLAGTFFSIGNFPNHHVLDHMQPTKRQMFRFNGRYVMERIKAGKAWVKIGVFFTCADWVFLNYFRPDYPDLHQFVSSIGAGCMLGLSKGPFGMLMSSLMFGAFTGVFHVMSTMVDFDFGPDPYAELDPRNAPPPFAHVLALQGFGPQQSPDQSTAPSQPAATPIPPMLKDSSYI